MLHRLAELGRLVSLLAGLGALVWAGFALISTSNEFGTHHPEDLGGPLSALIVFAVSIAVFIALGRLMKGEH